jgi:hypothetical protein
MRRCPPTTIERSNGQVNPAAGLQLGGFRKPFFRQKHTPFERQV